MKSSPAIQTAIDLTARAAGVGKGNGSDVKVQIMMKSHIVFFCSASKNCWILHDAETDSVTIHLSNCPPLYDDIKVQFFSSSALPSTEPTG
ncbi:phosphatidylinositol 3,4,5-trisphosphate 3-phosphatase TPTE2-like isoform X2 [Mustela erminea]|uniref:phosphatidylinositol 3,4,5-trisphosphate 3-phosphatase TPTE2-like isoform X2 n=1 Tax=Mustela erminea TaxID=36723 RepID=UPI00138697B9|nr:phosphatidylinositol 3,4,5-trisphosphate 3-phosphatase TPTE2-like isoform X2 [Mustela erminea]